MEELNVRLAFYQSDSGEKRIPIKLVHFRHLLKNGALECMLSSVTTIAKGINGVSGSIEVGLYVDAGESEGSYKVVKQGEDGQRVELSSGSIKY